MQERPLSPVAQTILTLLADNFGIDPRELSLTSDLATDLDIKSDVEALARFLHATNDVFDISLSLADVKRELAEGTLVIAQDLVNLVEDAMLE